MILMCEPTRLEMFLTRLAFFLCGKSVYRTFAERLPLEGGERVLDFGSGMGTVAFYSARRLPKGHLTCLDISKRWLNACRRTLRSYGNVTCLHSDASALGEDSFDVVYSHFVLHDIPKNELERVIPKLTGSLRTGGALIFREPLKDTDKISTIKRLLEKNGLLLKESRVTDIPLMGNALESFYIK